MPWSPPARHGTPTSPPTAPDARPLPSWPPDITSWRIEADGRGEPCAALRTNAYLDAHHGQSRPSSHQPDYTLLGTTPITAMQGQTTDEAPARSLDSKRLTLMSGQTHSEPSWDQAGRDVRSDRCLGADDRGRPAVGHRRRELNCRREGRVPPRRPCHRQLVKVSAGSVGGPVSARTTARQA